MSDVKNMHNELNPRLQQMLAAYAITPERDPEAARRAQTRFTAELDKSFVEPVATKTTIGWSIFLIWSSILEQLKQIPAHLFAKRSALFLIVTLMVLGLCILGGAAKTVYAASSALPGDALYSLKTTVESIHANLAVDSADQARLNMDFAGRRLFEIQSLIRKARYSDIPRATGEFEEDIQKSLIAIKRLSQIDPPRAAELKTEFAPILRSYGDILTQMLEGIPGDVQPALQSAVNASKSAADNGDDDDDAGSSTPTPTMTATPADILSTPVPGGSTPFPAPGRGGDDDSGSVDDGGGDDDGGSGDDNGGDDDGGGDG